MHRPATLGWYGSALPAKSPNFATRAHRLADCDRGLQRRYANHKDNCYMDGCAAAVSQTPYLPA